MSLSASDPASAPAAGPIARLASWGLPLSRPGVAFGVVAVLLALVVAIQVAMQTGGRNDDAELLLFSQTLAWGYDPLNPPLVVWLAWLMGQAVAGAGHLLAALGLDADAWGAALAGALGVTPNPGLLTTRVLIALLLFAAYPLARAATRTLTSDPGMATLSGLSLAALVAWAWAPHINLAHTVAMTTASFALVAVVLRLARAPSWGGFVLLGVVTGLALLTKYNIVLLLAALLLAGLATPTTRVVLRDGRLWLSIGLAAVIAAPHVVWLLFQWTAFRTLVDSKLGRDAAPTAVDADVWSGLVPGLASLGEHALMVILPAVPLALLVFWRALLVRPARDGDADPRQRDLFRFAALVPLLLLLLMAALVPLAGVTSFNPHHPYALIIVVVPLFAWLSRGRVTDAARGLFALVCVVLSLVVPLAMADMIHRTARTCVAKCNTALPYAAWADGLRAAGFGGGTVLVLGSVHHLPLENLRAFLPGARLLRPADHQKSGFAPPPSSPPGDCLVLWPAASLPETAARLRTGGLPGQGPDTRLPAEAVVGVLDGHLALSGRPAPPLGYALVPGGLGSCR
ncbi:glycosyltransferase family 39 protein [Roseospira visakhapatnamensis]|uniref:4-amino-4-deoxy-L-arabinose transferase-like glycosyltransferase n=1 Tax=Roseospira visakhapatnamensis TaxID=390880 RepID=A0A7W6RE35_9PROT|nr:glycosyltransferase family 39 protein [Roseospira visakhapatnamensis]MBB4266218.1 4-amino-4-deoxy-L-arabinose transferase-like glycosyltransferase [Roseospira visakhapatnamensis]